MRFKRDDGTVFPDWSSSEIGNVADTCSGGTPSTSVSEYWDGPIQWLTPTEINSKYVHNSKRTITSAGIASSSAKLLPIGALLLTTRATIGACSINNFDGDVSTNQGFQSLICKSSLFNEYAYYAITRDKFQKELIKHSSGSTFLEISSKNLKKLPIPIPCLEEQQKIASFFSTLDQKIELNERKLEALEKLKKGVMQRIFNQNIRFFSKDGTTYPNWKIVKLSDVADTFNGDRGKNYPSSQDYVPTGIPFINAGDLINGSVSESCARITIAKYNSLSGAKLQKGDILYCLRGTLGKNGVCPFDAGTLASSLMAIRAKDCINPAYLYYFLNSHLEREQRLLNDEGAAQPNLSQKNVRNFQIPLPCIEEQQKIADLLSILGRRIEIERKRAEVMRKLKQGFMQQMFI